MRWGNEKMRDWSRAVPAMRLKGRIALITGASRGLGAAAALAYAKEGAHCVLVARTVGGLEALDDQIKAMGGSATLVRSEEHTSELQSRRDLVCRLLLEKKNKS